MSWRILTDGVPADLERLNDVERSALADDLTAWVDSGPPRRNRRYVAGVEMFTDELPSGFAVVYLVDESVPYVAVLRIRRLPPGRRATSEGER